MARMARQASCQIRAKYVNNGRIWGAQLTACDLVEFEAVVIDYYNEDGPVGYRWGHEKLGKEVEQLIAIGQVTHPGLQRGFQRLQDIQHQIDAAEQAVAAGLAEDNDEE